MVVEWYEPRLETRKIQPCLGHAAAAVTHPIDVFATPGQATLPNDNLCFQLSTGAKGQRRMQQMDKRRMRLPSCPRTFELPCRRPARAQPAPSGGAAAAAGRDSGYLEGTACLRRLSRDCDSDVQPKSRPPAAPRPGRASPPRPGNRAGTAADRDGPPTVHTRTGHPQ